MHEGMNGPNRMNAKGYGRLPLAGLAVIGANMSCGNGQPNDTARLDAGFFRMGTPEPTIVELRTRFGVSFPGSFENEIPAHEIAISGFRIDRYEVTNARYAAFVAARPEWGPGQLPAHLHNGHYLDHWDSGAYPEEKGDHPVVFVTWHAAQAFCRWQGGRLPTEAEWEYAARGGGGDKSEFPWGNELPSPERANYGASGLQGTAPVGSYPPNSVGLHDMAGNVWEWLLDAWEPVYSSEARADPVIGGHVSDDAIRDVGGRRAIRGGSYGGAVVNLRTRWRDSHEATNATDAVGFRCVYSDDRRPTSR
jgi:formylglycine-generating enzyme